MVRQTDTGSARLVLVAMTLANGMILVDQTAVPLALPAIMQDFKVQSQAVQWVLNGSLLPLAGLLVLGGRLGDLLGRRRVFVVGRSCSPWRPLSVVRRRVSLFCSLRGSRRVWVGP
jgi:MFS family permease